MYQARKLPFDYRLELEGVLQSWAVQRGPRLNPADKRPALEVEDHPLGYSDFKGVIPKEQYGAGQTRNLESVV